MNVAKIIGLFALCYLMFSCNKDIEHPNKDIEHPINEESGVDTLSITFNFLFNVPIVVDTVFIDIQHNIDIRIELEGYLIEDIIITNNDRIILRSDTSIISSGYFCNFENPERVEFLILSVNLEDNDTVYLKSKPLIFKAVENLSNRYVYPSIDDGKLKLTWLEFDKNNTQKYLVERWVIDSNFGQNNGKKKYHQTFEVDNAVFIDNYYVGEEADYKIMIINHDGNIQNMWYYKKSKEQPNYYVIQNSTGDGYNVHFSKCKYFNNFGQYYLTDGWNYNPTFIHSTNQVSDTTLLLADARFGDEVRLWIRYLPKQLPDGFLEEDWNIYGKFIYAQYGIASISYENITILDNNNIAYIKNGKIFKHNIVSNQDVDSIVKQGAYYGFIKSTPDGKYIYSSDNSSFTPAYFWSTDFSQNPIYNFSFTHVIAPVSNNLRTITSIPSNFIPSKLAIYDITNGSMIYTTKYDGSGDYPTISPNGDYFFIHNMGLHLCKYTNNSLEVIWSELNFRRFYNFNRLNNDLCYVWGNNNIFSIRRTSDFSVIYSFPLVLDAIVDIDYYSNKILGYVADKIMIYDLNNGNLIKEIPAYLSGLSLSSNRMILLGNTIYNNNGIKYELNQ